jgi:hypothetical protein
VETEIRRETIVPLESKTRTDLGRLTLLQVTKKDKKGRKFNNEWFYILGGNLPAQSFQTKRIRIMIHCFDANLAKEFGIEEAIFIDKLVGWIQYNKANGINYHDGRTWTFNSAKAYADIFPYMTMSKIKRAIANLVEKGVVMKGNYNENQYDRT